MSNLLDIGVLKKLGFGTRVEAALWASESGHKGSLTRVRSRSD